MSIAPKSLAMRVCLILSFAATAMIAEIGQAQVIYFNDFDQHTSSRKYKVSDLEAEWNAPDWDNGVSEGRVRIERRSNAYGGNGACLVVKYPKGKYGTGATGAQWKMELEDTYEEVFSTYRVKFKNGTDFVKGGKLPGLAGGTAPTGTTAATGYNGWTGRMMWLTSHTGNPGSPKQKRANMISYAKYHKSGYDNDGKDEDETFFTADGSDALIEIRSNRWYTIEQRIKMNDHWTNNGIIQIWLNGELVVDKQDVWFRRTSDIGIDVFYFSTFFGGGYSWRTSRWTTAYFDDFSIIAIE